MMFVGALEDFDKPPPATGGSAVTAGSAGAVGNSAQSASVQPHTDENTSAAPNAQVKLHID